MEAIRPGVWLIHNDAPRTEALLFELMHALPVDRLRAEGIHVVGVGPTQDGFLHVSVMGDVPTAQARFDAMFRRQCRARGVRQAWTSTGSPKPLTLAWASVSE